MNTKPRLCLIGNGSMIRICARIAKRESSVNLHTIVTREDSGKLPKELSADESLNIISYQKFDRNVEDLIIEKNPDIIVSIYNIDIIKERVCKDRVAINFHDSPLPKYAGVNAVSWGLFNGETTWGVTWHLMKSQVDTGSIVIQECFPIHFSWNALDLSIKCIEVGCDLFKKMLPEVASTSIQSIPQNLNKRTYFSTTKTPFNGKFPFCVTYDTLSNFRRAISYYPAPNNFCEPEINIGEISFNVITFSLERISGNVPPVPGQILDISKAGIRIGAACGEIVISLVCDSNGQKYEAFEFAKSTGLRIGKIAKVYD